VHVTDNIGLPPVAAGDIALVVAWFVLGFMLYAFLFTAAASLVNKITEVGSAILPVMMILVVGYMLAITVVTTDPGGGWSVAASVFPLTAPLAMPIRWAAAEVSPYQLLLAMRALPPPRCCSSGSPHPSTAAPCSSSAAG
jgi:ABC-2 type transport system permease protein